MCHFASSHAEPALVIIFLASSLILTLCSSQMPFRVRRFVSGEVPGAYIILRPPAGASEAAIEKAVAGSVSLPVGSFFISNEEGTGFLSADLTGDWNVVPLPTGACSADVCVADRCTMLCNATAPLSARGLRRPGSLSPALPYLLLFSHSVGGDGRRHR